MVYFLVVIIRYSKQCPPLAWQNKTTVHGSLNLNFEQLISRPKVVQVQYSQMNSRILEYTIS